ncbi:MAG: hypothetical protein ACKVWV_06810 [Planctomycetota bacterium]
MSRTRWYRHAAFVLPASLIVGAVLAELAVRFALFHDSALARRLGAQMRDGGHFADAEGDDDYWKLRRMFMREPHEPPGFDRALGWTGRRVEPATYRHVDDEPGDPRRLVLLYGDSYAGCMTPDWQCFPSILETSELGETHRMLDYGVVGYGVDQTCLMIERSIDLYRERRPIVIVGLLVENTLERTVLSFREWPKPRLAEVGGELVLEEELAPDFDTYLERHPLRIPSYLWRYATFTSTRVPEALRAEGHAASVEEKKRRGRAILHAIDRALDGRGIEYFVLLFHPQNALEVPAWAPWQENFVREVCAEVGARVVCTRPYLRAARAGERDATPLYIDGGPAIGHLNGLGNAVAFEAMRDGIEGAPPETGIARIAAQSSGGRLDVVLRAHATVELFGRRGRVHGERDRITLRASESRVPPFDTWGDSSRTCLTPGIADATRIDLELGAGTRRLRALVRATAYPADPQARGAVLLEIERDGASVLRTELAVGGAALALDFELGGARELSITATPLATTPRDARVCFSDPTLE